MTLLASGLQVASTLPAVLMKMPRLMHRMCEQRRQVCLRGSVKRQIMHPHTCPDAHGHPHCIRLVTTSSSPRMVCCWNIDTRLTSRHTTAQCAPTLAPTPPHSLMLVTTPTATVRPPSRSAMRPSAFTSANLSRGIGRTGVTSISAVCRIGSRTQSEAPCGRTRHQHAEERSDCTAHRRLHDL